MKTDIEIAQACTMLPITQVAEELGVSQEVLEPPQLKGAGRMLLLEATWPC